MPEFIIDAGLTGIVVIDITIGVIFAILTFSLIASALQEAIAGVLNYRGEHLRKGIMRLVREDNLGRELLKHPSIAALKGPKNLVQKVLQILFIWGDGARDKDRMPSSIPKGTFARSLVETLVERRMAIRKKLGSATTAVDQAMEEIGREIDNLAMDKRLKQRLKEVVNRVDFDQFDDQLAAMIDGTMDKARLEAVNTLNQALDALEQDLARWFDTSMDRVTGWYVRRAKTMLFAIGFVMAAALGFDIVGYGRQLATDEAFRNAIVSRAEAAAASGEVGTFRVDGGKLADIATSADDGSPPSEAQRNAATALEMFDQDGDTRISEAEAAEADRMLRAALAVVNERATEAIATVRTELGHETVALNSSFWAADWMGRGQMLLSWLIIGLGCTLGGQFWFDILKGILNVRAGASGLVTDQEKPAVAK